MEVLQIRRKFNWNDNGTVKELPDPGEQLTPTEVLELHSISYPQLTTASVTGPEIKDDYRVYTFSTVVGTKG